MEEIWKTIENYSNYEVSTCGNVRNKRTGMKLSPWVTAEGYLRVAIADDSGFRKQLAVHRIVAYTFIPLPPSDLPLEVNHIDEKKTNNCVDNLEWVTHQQNCNHGTRNKRISKQAVMRDKKTGKVLKVYGSQQEAAKDLGVQPHQISEWVNGKKICRKYDWSAEV